MEKLDIENASKETILSLPQFSSLNITDEEFRHFHALLVRIYKEDEECKNSKESGCPLDLCLHSKLVRNSQGKLIVVQVDCPKAKDGKALNSNYIMKPSSEVLLKYRIDTKTFPNDKFGISKALNGKSTGDLLSELNKQLNGGNLQLQGLYVYGPVGVGKTSIMAAFANELAIAGKKVAFVNVQSVYNKIKEQYDDPHGKRNYNDLMKNADILILDDFGASLTSHLYIDILFNVLDERAGAPDKYTYFTSNLSLDHLSNSLMRVPKVLKEDVIRFMERVRQPVNNKETDIAGENLRYKKS
ncbi:MAG: ATP-binding protein [Mycoplasmataceae bacterium]|jgi:DNA replication protein DnaC|nr:ATP-binding protein [Mycoplasmataceae bacterium]